MAMQPPPTQAESLRRKITVVLIVKVTAVLLLYALFFSPAERPDIDAGRIEERLLGAPASPAPEDRHP